ncbi:hypothetical protein BKA70DRAFT_1407394, partial [Coprinopsis sp. MPI-PUGE-AT-0042]
MAIAATSRRRWRRYASIPKILAFNGHQTGHLGCATRKRWVFCFQTRRPSGGGFQIGSAFRLENSCQSSTTRKSHSHGRILDTDHTDHLPQTPNSQ